MKLTNDIISLIPYAEVDINIIGKQYLDWLNDLDVTTSIGSYSLLIPKSMDFIDESYKRFTSKTAIGFFIFDEKTASWIGTAKIDKIDVFNSSAEVGIMIGDKSFWGKGIASMTYELLLKCSFDNFNLYRVWGGCLQSNIGMIKVFKKNNFKQEAILREAVTVNGVRENSLLFSILKYEYKK